MFTIQRWLALPTMLVTIIAASTMAFAQGTSTTGAPSSPKPTPNSSQWPNQCDAGCGHGGVGGGLFGSFEEGYHKWKADFELVSARNCAWPLPFNCQDREIYYRIWAAQYATGLQVAHTLTGEHFDAETHELNNAGKSRIAWIMQNAPSNSKQIYVFEDQPGRTITGRIKNVRSVIDQWYSHMGPAVVARTRIFPNQVPASYQEIINQQYAAGLPIPTIPVSSGSSIGNAVGGN